MCEMMESLGYVKAKYEYEYQSSIGEPRKMHPGDQFILIKKSNDDWWYVQQKGEPKGVYLPATYLEEVVTVSNGEGFTNERFSTFGMNRASVLGRNHGSNFESVMNSFPHLTVDNDSEPHYMNFRRSNSTGDELSADKPPNGDNTGRLNSFIPRLPVDLPTQQFSTFLPVANPHAVIHRPARSPDEHNSPSPIGINRHAVSRRPHRGRGRRAYSFRQRYLETELLNERTLPPGWHESKDDLGVTFYTHENATERWRMNKDENGRCYFYNENGHSSKWELPDLSNPASRRLSENLEDFGPRRIRSKRAVDRVAKTQSVYVEGVTRGSRRSRTLPSGIPENDFAIISSPYGAKLPSSISAYDIHHKAKEDSPPTLVEKSGYMYCLRLKDVQRKSKNKVTKVYVVLTSASIVIYKDQQMFEGRSGSLGRPDSSIELNEATLKAVDKDFKPKGKNAFHLMSHGGNELTLYSEKPQDSDAWFDAIKDRISKLSPAGHRPDRSAKASISDEDDDIPARVLNRGASRKQTADKKKIRNKLIPFITKRPSKRDLEIKGILKEENVFGKRLDKLCEKEGTVIPKFVEICIATIDRKGLNVDGIYRVSGNLSLVQKLRCEIDLEREVNLEKPPWDDIHVLTGALKLFFRELPDPLIPCTFYQQFMSALKFPDRPSRIKQFRDLIKKLPNCNYATMKMLFHHLLRVAAKSDVNRMQVHNLAIVFGPTLMWPQEDTTMGNVALNLIYQNQIIEFLLHEMKNVF